ncbi:MAG: hypothetical protein RAO94_04365 [Candidatus Stygibacter australis]|nr:hypothetical protein [Candidatus Stygibacter australis]
MEILIKEVRNKRQLRSFVNFPGKLYKGNKYWIPQLSNDEMSLFDPVKNPAFEFCESRQWLAYKNNRIVGRIAGIINHKYIEKWNDRYCRFGWIDFIDDKEVSQALINEVENWAEGKGLTAVHGPLGFTDLDPEGMLIEGFEEESTIATIYNYPYYPEHLRELGYEKDADWIEYEIKIPAEVPERITRIAGIVQKKNNLRIIHATKIGQLKPYLYDVFEVLNNSYKDLYGFIPLSEKQITLYIKQYISLANPEYISLILDKNDRVAAFGLTFPSLSRAFQKAKGSLFPLGFIHILRALKKKDIIDLYLIGVRPELQGKGANALILSQLIESYIRNGIDRAESNPELETNNKVQDQWKFFDRRQHKRRRCFIRHFVRSES